MLSFFGSTNQFIKFLPNRASFGSPLRPLFNKKSIFTWSDDHTIAFEKIKSENVKITKKTDVKLNTRVKSDASHNGLGAMLD